MSNKTENVGVDIKKFFEVLSLRKLGTGIIATMASVKPDVIQQLIHFGEGPEELVTKLVELLGPTILEDEGAVDLDNESDADLEVDEILDDYEDEEDAEVGVPFELEGANMDSVLDAIESGRITKEEAVAFEKSKDSPRKTLLESLE